MHDTYGPRWPESSPSADQDSCSQRTFRWPHSKNPGETFAGWATESRQLSDSVRATLGRCFIATDGGYSLPTLTKCANLTSPSMQKWPAHRMLATLTARDYRSGKASEATHARNARPLSEQLGGLLHPDFCDWYQGMPAGWSRGRSGSRRSATRRFQSWLRRLLGS